MAHWYYKFEDDLYPSEKKEYVDSGDLWEYKGTKYYYLGFYNVHKRPNKSFKTKGSLIFFGKHPPYEDFKEVTTV